MKIKNITVHDIRFPTSLQNLGTDAVHVDCDYSATYVKIYTEDPKLNGTGISFTIGKGNELCVSALAHFTPLFLGKTVSEVEAEMASLWKQCTNHSQLRWVGPEKGVIHLAVASLFNGLWDLVSKFHNKPLWQYILDLGDEELLQKLTFSYLDDVISEEEALRIIRGKRAQLNRSRQDVLGNGFPCYTTAAGWLGYSDEKMTNLTNEYLKQGWTHFKVKVGQDIDRDIKRCGLIRELIGCENKLMVDANQIWSVNESIENINLLKEFDLFFVEEPTHPDDILGFKKIKNSINDVKLATGEMCQNRILFKQFIEHKALDFLQIDSCRLASISEIIPILLIASKFDIPVIAHAGGVGLCEYVQHLNIINKCLITNNSTFMSEYADSCAEHLVNPAKIANGSYITPKQPGYSAIIKDSSIKEFEYPNGNYWKTYVH